MRQPAVARGLSLIPPPAVTQHAVMSRPNMLSEATAEGNLLPGEPMGVPLSPSAQTALPPQELVVSDEVQTLVAKAGDPHELLLKVSPASLRVNSFATPQAFLVVAWGDVTMQQADVQTQMAEAGNPHESQFRVRSACLGPCSCQPCPEARCEARVSNCASISTYVLKLGTCSSCYSPKSPAALAELPEPSWSHAMTSAALMQCHAGC